MFSHLGKQKALILFGVLAFFVLALVVLIACLNLNGYPSSGEQILSSVPVVIGKSDWAFVIRNNGESDKVSQMPPDPWDIQGLTASSVNAQFYSVGAASCNLSQYKDAVAQTLDQIDLMQRVFEKYQNYFIPAISSRDISKARELHKIGGFLAVNGGYALDSRMSVLRDYYTSASSLDPDGSRDQSLKTQFGQAVVHEMNRLGMIIDLTGSSKTIQLEAIENSTAPVIFSSSGSEAITTHPLNVDDEVLRALADKGGLIMVPFDSLQCCSDSSNCTVDNVFEHINYIATIAGRQSVGLGGDVQVPGKSYPQGLSTSNGYITLFNKFMSNNSWSVEELQNLAGNNFLRVMRAVEEVSRTMKEGGATPAEISINIAEIPSNDRSCYASLTGGQPNSLQSRQSAEANFYQKLYSFQEETVATSSATNDYSTSSETNAASTDHTGTDSSTTAPLSITSSDITTPSITTTSSENTTPNIATTSSGTTTTTATTQTHSTTTGGANQIQTGILSFIVPPFILVVPRLFLNCIVHK